MSISARSGSVVSTGRDSCVCSVFLGVDVFFFFFSSRRRHTRYWRDWSSGRVLFRSADKDGGFLRQPIAVGRFHWEPQAENTPAFVDVAPQLLLLPGERLIPSSFRDDQGCHIRRPRRETRNAFEPEAGLLKRRSRLAARII